jgi:hypothetical protein
MKAFVPVTDETLDALNGTETLVPYRPGLPLASQFAVTEPPVGNGLNPDEVRAGRPDAGPVRRPCPR